MSEPANNTQIAVLGGGCFWCLEAAYQQIKGIESVVSGYAGGDTVNPTYEQIERAGTGHAQVVKLTFDPSIITFADVLDIFWAIHDPTTKDRQNYDVGPQYRSIILYTSDEQRDIAETSRDAIAKKWPNPITTEIKPLEHFYEAEAYHQNYFKNHPERAYCQIIINPKLAKLREKFATRLRADAQA
jgi:peptide-methionine (S)-S-oxide reductase